MQYVIGKDEETNEIELIGRFKGGLGEIWRDNEWISESGLYRDLHDGLLDYVTEAEALKLIEERQSRQLQVA
jgi:hypothetical protein